ncbi:MAG: hypothetical protein EA344_01665 [Alkalicoccus sp.]|nr:MAG: hypothetical protein EA344_01665 [Alkalicoccus sp.]
MVVPAACHKAGKILDPAGILKTGLLYNSICALASLTRKDRCPILFGTIPALLKLFFFVSPVPLKSRTD